MIIPAAKRTENIREYYFSLKLKEIAALNQKRTACGEKPVVNLGIGSPNGMPPEKAIQALASQTTRPDVHAYQSYTGIPELRQAMAGWYRRYYDTDLDPNREIQPLTGSKEGILLISLAFLNEGDKVLVPDPGYPTYTSASRLAGAEIIPYDLIESQGWQPDFEVLEKMDLEGVRIMWTNYPNMPTGGRATEELYSKLVRFGKKHKILICNDNPYSFILNDHPLSILQTDGARECALELNSLSKAHNMSGWRIGMVAAAPEIISTILKVKSQMDSGMFRPLQLAAVKALEEGPQWYEALNGEYRKRKRHAGEFYDTIGVGYDKDSNGMFLWGKASEDNPMAYGALPDGSVPEAKDPGKSLGERISDYLLYRHGIFITPGFIFGKNGRNYVRISLCSNAEVYEELARGLKQE